MLDVSNQAPSSEMSFKEFVGKLIKSSEPTRPQSSNYQIVENLQDHLKNLDKAYEYLSSMSEKKKIASSGIEWFLDNFYVIQEAVDLIEDDLPSDYFNKLPSIQEASGTPRIYHIARGIVAFYQIELVREDLNEFLSAFQEETPLKMSELWALPLMLRLALIEILSGTIYKLIENESPGIKTDHIKFSGLSDDEIIARSLKTLLFFDRMDWKEFFEAHSQVNKILRKDPDGVYASMDFSTRDQYRKKIEHLAEHTNKSETEVSNTAIDLANDSSGKSEKESHIGFYLLDDGTEKLKQAIGYQYTFTAKINKLFFDHNTAFYLGSIALITLLVVFGLIAISRLFNANGWSQAVIGLLSLIPASSVAVNLINSILTAVLPPKILPKMDFRKKIPRKFRTVVGIPALLTGFDEVDFLLQQLELHYLANKDKNIGFVLLSDFSDAPQETMPEDNALLEAAVGGIKALNKRYQSDQGRQPFYLFHRRRQYNPKENIWMGWERKRGKLTDFNHFLLEGKSKSFANIHGELDFLKRVRFVITVDSDTVLPRDSANQLIATLAHPLNQAEFEEGTQTIKRGYTILQPRTEVKPTSVTKSFFSRVFAGDLGLDLYTRAVSDVYQDLFGEGIFVGKGIYDVAAFHRSIEGKVPRNALLSHDLFEGIQGRAGLVSDIVFFEEYPPNYASQVERLHRWVRGDWQLLPWLFPKVPSGEGERESNPFDLIDHWKLLDNLRRSLLSPATFILFVAGWLLFSQNAWVWTLIILLISAFPLFKNIVSSLSSRFLLGAKANVLNNIKTAFFRWVFWLIFLPYESLIMLDAIVTTLVRVYISHKRLLQWQTSAHTLRIFGKQRKISTIWQRMIGAPLLSISVAILVQLINPDTFWTSIPLLILWLISPQISYWISVERERDKKEPLNESDLRKLRSIARRTWLYFEHFIGPEDHWLPPDHFQEDPKGMVAHRTSPTNIGLMMLTTAAAYDFGYIGVIDFIYRMNYTFTTLDGLEKYRGHLFNWYDTSSLNTLSPRYVSTVDSGNYATSLIGLYQVLKDLPDHTVCPSVLFDGTYDSLDVFCTITSEVENQALGDVVDELLDHCRNIQGDIKEERLTDSRQMNLLDDFEKRLSEPMNILTKTLLRTEETIDPVVLQDIRYWSDSVFQHLKNIKRQVEILAPWMETWQNRPDFIDDLENDFFQDTFKVWYEDRALQTELKLLPKLCEETSQAIAGFLENDDVRVSLDLSESQVQSVKQWLQEFNEDLEQSKDSVKDICDNITDLLEKIDFYLERMEFGFLFDKKREVFYLGYQVGSGRLDKNHYDLLASEARTASLFAIAKNDVPRSHWLHMSRPFTVIADSLTLVSWNGSMFEYLMPNLYTRTYPETLLHQTSKGVVDAQIAYGKKKGVPWGISESSYYRFDNAENYQYQGFGVPGLGRKRGLADDLVIAPYASLLAVDVSPKAVLENIDRLIKEGALGHFGFFESIDYTTSRLPVNHDKAVVKTYMAHHQGMIFVALANFLNPETIVDRVHDDPRIQSTELLLQEQIPEAETKQKTEEAKITTRGEGVEAIAVEPWSIQTDRPGKSVHTISNGNLRMLMTESGSGYLEWNDIALTRWRQDAVLDPWGIWFFIQDLNNQNVWSIGRQPIYGDPQEYRVIYAPHMTEIRHVVDDIRVIMQSTITPKDDVCLQKITLTNQSSDDRNYRILSYGEVVLAPQATDQQHPAFNKLFIESEYHEEMNLLYFRRRARSSEEKPRGMAHLIYDDLTGEVAYESDRERFIGRGNDISNPRAVLNQDAMEGKTGVTLDPIFSLGKRFSLKPNQTITLTYMTIAAENLEKAETIASKYQSQNRIDDAFASAESYSEKLLRSLDLESNQLSRFQELLSHVIYPIPELRPDHSILQENTLSQSGLWSFGISGDYPILLVMIDRQDEIEALQETILAHTYWRKIGLMIDLVILNTRDVGYTHELNERIHQAINIMDSQSWVNRRGGIFVLTASQIESKGLTLLKSAASVVIDFKTRELEDHLKQAGVIEPALPPFIPTGPSKDFSVRDALSRPEDLVFDNGIGGFSADGREYQIFLTDYPKQEHGPGQVTPAPWINVVANENFGFLISETGGGYTWAVNSGENRLTPWSNDPVSDPAGECLYIRDEISGKIWSPTPYPAGRRTNYLVKHGQGYTVFESLQHGFKQQMKVFTDSEAPVKIIELTITNLTEDYRRITATYYAEWVLGANRDKTKAFIVPSFSNQSGSLLARNTYSSEFSERVAFLTSDHPLHGLTTDRREFIGRHGNHHEPAGLKRVGLSGNVKTGVDPCAALQIHENFEPGESQKITFILGQGSDDDEARKLAQTFSDQQKIEESWSAIQNTWETFLSKLNVETPAPEMDMVLNRWLPYQALSCRIWGRSAFYQSSGAYGYRDQLQDVSSLLAMEPEIARKHILRSARHQFDAGDVLHWWHPPQGRGVRTRITDDLLWLVYVTAEYVEKTGDVSILEEKVPFRQGDPLDEDEEERYDHYETGEKSYSLFEHCRRALEKGDTEGPHGLPLMGSGDWNDGMNRVGIDGSGESVWLAWFLYENHKRFASLCEMTKRDQEARNHRSRAEELQEVVDRVAWDDEWYLRAYYDDGTPLGSHRNEECKIDSLPQSWSILTQGAPLEKQEQAIKSVEAYLVQKEMRLIQLFTPPFDKTKKDPGYIKGYPPGIRENGGQYTHAATWAVWALTKLGHGNQAFEQFGYLNPVTHSLNIEEANTYAVEPYVVAADIYSTPPFVGHGGWTWYTGSSGWLYRLGIEAILGFTIAGDHFQVDPCIPDSWDGFKINYRKDDNLYRIKVENPDHVEKGIKEIQLDGQNFENDLIPFQEDGQDHDVLIIMGKTG